MTVEVAGRTTEARGAVDVRHSFIANQWVETRDLLNVVDPGTGKPFAQISLIGPEDVERALETAGKAFHLWRQTPALNRGTVLHRIADQIGARKTEIARTITLENGKPFAQSMGEIDMSVDHLRWFAEEGRRVYGRTIPNQVNGKRHLTVKTPIGVVGAIAPWNFPLVLSVRKIAPAMAAGCSVILKPALETPLSAVLLAECIQAADVPEGVFQVLLGDAPMISQAFLRNPICRKVSFTGSTQVGRILIQEAAQTIKPLCLELGGLAPVLVFDDCDLDIAVRETVIAKFRNTGQSCIAANRICVQEGIYREFRDRFVVAVKNLKTGYGLENGMDVGPMISERALERALLLLDEAIRNGAHVLAGGKRLAGNPGFFLEPTVIENVTQNSICMREEIFAPIAPLASFETEDEAIELANQSDYGLSAYAMTRDLGRMFRLSERIEAGTLGINDGAPTTSTSPFGGVKQSGWGRELGTEGLDAFLETKHVSLGHIL